MSGFTPKQAAVWLQLKVRNVLVTSFLILTGFLDFCQRNGVQFVCMKEDTEKAPINQPTKPAQQNQSRLLWVWFFALYAACPFYLSNDFVRFMLKILFSPFSFPVLWFYLLALLSPRVLLFSCAFFPVLSLTWIFFSTSCSQLQFLAVLKSIFLFLVSPHLLFLTFFKLYIHSSFCPLLICLG